MKFLVYSDASLLLIAQRLAMTSLLPCISAGRLANVSLVVSSNVVVAVAIVGSSVAQEMFSLAFSLVDIRRSDANCC